MLILNTGYTPEQFSISRNQKLVLQELETLGELEAKLHSMLRIYEDNVCSLLSICYIYLLFLDSQQKAAAEARKNNPEVSYNPTNPFDTLLPEASVLPHESQERLLNAIEHMPYSQNIASQSDQLSIRAGTQDTVSQLDEFSTYAGTDLLSVSTYSKRKRKATTAKDQDIERIRKENEVLRLALQACQERDELRKENERLQRQLDSQ